MKQGTTVTINAGEWYTREATRGRKGWSVCEWSGIQGSITDRVTYYEDGGEPAAAIAALAMAEEDAIPELREEAERAIRNNQGCLLKAGHRVQ
jgi:hypothetical protein